ncbi:PEP-CTERM sorting domain-containing protein [Hahella sp. CR1]|uniref:PEP-CTERM sorting domain-containing protein n=1 Tax=Hahella sp. CR1 TaxID=2992807 RepID=UPI002442C94A|nr:PEP-CTERM sorting domain-containing protein [Hahella sp. CR1]MDG9670044.1 PEP-CTERM sorting domain-containing protein [Hahella sp. CR1]
MKLTTTLLSVSIFSGIAFQANAALVEMDFEGVFSEVESGDSPYEIWGDIFYGTIQLDSRTPVSEYSTESTNHSGDVWVDYSGKYNNAITDFSFLIGGDKYHLDGAASNDVTVAGYVTYDEEGNMSGYNYYTFSFSAWLESVDGKKVKISYLGSDAYREKGPGSDVLYALPTDGYGPSSMTGIDLEGYDASGNMTYKIKSISSDSASYEFKKVPEPYTASMLLIGIAGLTARRFIKA